LPYCFDLLVEALASTIVQGHLGTELYRANSAFTGKSVPKDR